jgi:hypothetical protein
MRSALDRHIAKYFAHTPKNKMVAKKIPRTNKSRKNARISVDPKGVRGPVGLPPSPGRALLLENCSMQMCNANKGPHLPASAGTGVTGQAHAYRIRQEKESSAKWAPHSARSSQDLRNGHDAGTSPSQDVNTLLRMYV